MTVDDNQVMEREATALLPSNVSLHTTRMVGEGYEQLAESACDRVRDLVAADVDIVVYGCTSGSFFRGRRWETEYRARLQQISQRTVVTTAKATVDALHALGAQRVSVATPYPAWVDGAQQRYLAEVGVQVVGPRSKVAMESADAINRLTRQEVLQMVRSAWSAEADALLVSCTAVPIVDMIADLEAELDVPVVTSTQAAVWAVLAAMGAPHDTRSAGSLLTNGTSVATFGAERLAGR